MFAAPAGCGSPAARPIGPVAHPRTGPRLPDLSTASPPLRDSPSAPTGGLWGIAAGDRVASARRALAAFARAVARLDAEQIERALATRVTMARGGAVVGRLDARRALDRHVDVLARLSRAANVPIELTAIEVLDLEAARQLERQITATATFGDIVGRATVRVPVNAPVRAPQSVELKVLLRWSSGGWRIVALAI